MGARPKAVSEEYQALLQKVDAFCAEANVHAGKALTCKRGCDGCCHVWLTVSPVEARAIREHLAGLDSDTRARIAERGRREQARESRGEVQSRCAMLEDDGSCAIYEARPVICRTQGFPLRYPKGTVPESAVRWLDHTAGTEIVACPLNYTQRLPQAAETLDADTVNILLAVVNQRDADRTRGDPGVRSPLSELAADTDVIACG